VDKRVENTLLTGRGSSSGAGFNTLLISQAKIFIKKINTLQIGSCSTQNKFLPIDKTVRHLLQEQARLRRAGRNPLTNIQPRNSVAEADARMGGPSS